MSEATHITITSSLSHYSYQKDERAWPGNLLTKIMLSLFLGFVFKGLNLWLQAKLSGRAEAPERQPQVSAGLSAVKAVPLVVAIILLPGTLSLRSYLRLTNLIIGLHIYISNTSL
jgi:hypothetical protein